MCGVWRPSPCDVCCPDCLPSVGVSSQRGLQCGGCRHLSVQSGPTTKTTALTLSTVYCHSHLAHTFHGLVLTFSCLGVTRYLTISRSAGTECLRSIRAGSDKEDMSESVASDQSDSKESFLESSVDNLLLASNWDLNICVKYFQIINICSHSTHLTSAELRRLTVQLGSCWLDWGTWGSSGGSSAGLCTITRFGSSSLSSCSTLWRLKLLKM